MERWPVALRTAAITHAQVTAFGTYDGLGTELPLRGVYDFQFAGDDLRLELALNTGALADVFHEPLNPPTRGHQARRQLHITAMEQWIRAARMRGEIEHYLFPLLLAEVARDITALAAGRARKRTPDSPVSAFAPEGPWQLMRRDPREYLLQATASFDLRATKCPPAQLLKDLLTYSWILSPQRVDLDYAPTASVRQ